MQNIQEDKNKNKNLDGLRGYAAIAVIIVHSIFLLNRMQNVMSVPIYKVHGIYFKIAYFFLLIFNGQVAVYIFFVLSGMFLFQSLLRNNQNFVITFSVKRVIRIFFPLIPCLIVFI